MVVFADSTYSQVILGNEAGPTPAPISRKPLNESDDSRQHLTYPRWDRRPGDPHNHGPLSVDGIAHARPSANHHNLINKPEKEVVEGSTPAQLFKPVNKVQSSSLKTDDLVDTKRFVPFYVRAPRNQNPNVPVYVLPSDPATQAPAPEEKRGFVRDAMAVADINGDTVHDAPARRPPRRTSTESCKDIHGASARETLLPHRRDPQYERAENMRTEDINRKGQSDSCSRLHLLDVQAVKDLPTWEVPGSRSRARTHSRVDGVDSCMTTEDIDGARPKDPWEPFNSRVTVQPKVPGKALRDPNRVDDVDGAKTRTQEKEAKELTLKNRSTTQQRREEEVPVGRAEALEILKKSVSEDASVRNLWTGLRKIDRERCGKVDVHELRSALAECNIAMSAKDAHKVMRAYDTDNSGFMNYTALTHEAISHLSGPKTREVDSVDTAGGALAQQGSGLAEVVNYKSYDGQLGHSVSRKVMVPRPASAGPSHARPATPELKTRSLARPSTAHPGRNTNTRTAGQPTGMKKPRPASAHPDMARWSRPRLFAGSREVSETRTLRAPHQQKLEHPPAAPHPTSEQKAALDAPAGDSAAHATLTRAPHANPPGPRPTHCITVDLGVSSEGGENLKRQASAGCTRPTSAPTPPPTPPAPSSTSRRTGQPTGSGHPAGVPVGSRAQTPIGGQADRPATAGPARRVPVVTFGNEPGGGAPSQQGSRPGSAAPRVAFSAKTGTIVGVPDSAAVHRERQKDKRRPRSAFVGGMREPGRKHFDLSQVPGKAPPGMEWDPLRINDNDNLYQSAFGYHLLVPQTNNKLLWILAREVLKHSIFAMG